MRLVVHDFAGHPFQAELSRALARRGHAVLHLYCGSLTTTPQGGLAPRPDDPAALRIEAVAAPGFSKTHLVRRWRAERAYGRAAAARLRAFRPDAVLSANTPLDAQRALAAAARAEGARFVFWLQDLIGEATYRILRAKLPVAGALVGRYYRAVEGRLLRASDAVVAITDDFRPVLAGMGVAAGRVHVVENWAPLADVPVRPRANAWRAAHGYAADARLVVYTGTLGLKHNPALLVALAEAFRDRPDVRVVVASQGTGADVLRAEAAARALPRLDVLPFQPFEVLPDVLGAADVLVALLEPDAGVFSVPSKVLTYLCAGRPLLLAVPAANLAARAVGREDAGLVVDPTDPVGFVGAARRLLDDPALGAAMGARARAYAERAFAIAGIADRFEAVLAGPGARAGLPSPR